MNAGRDQEFTEYVTARTGSLRRLAYLLCQDADHVDDLVQAAMTRLYVHWSRARAVDHLDAYVRTILIRVYLKDRGSGWARRVELTGQLPDASGLAEDREGALDLRAALAALPPRQRATLVLRFYCDLSVVQTADLLGCSQGTVKSQTAKGLDALRRALGNSETGPPAGALPAPPSIRTSGHMPLEVKDHG